MRGLADLQWKDTYWGPWSVSLLAFLVAGAAVAAANLIMMYGPLRFGQSPSAPPHPPFQWTTLAVRSAFYFYLIGSLWRYNASQPSYARMSGAWMLTALLLGLISAIGAIWLATAVQMLFEAPIPGATLGPFLVIPFNRLSAGTRLLSRLYQVKPPFKVTLPTAVRSKLLRALGPGFDDPANPQTLLRGHEFAMWLLIITGVFYLVPAYLFYYRVLLPAQPLTYYVPGLYWILIAALLACWSMSFATFVLDLYRIPLIAGITLYVGLVAVFVHSDHFFATHRLRADAKTTSQIG